MPTTEDVSLALTGDHDAFARLIKACESTMYHTAKSILINDSDCADAMQEAVLKAYRSLHSLKKPEYFKTWLIRIVINESKRIRAKARRSVPLSDHMEHTNSNETLMNRSVDVREMLRGLDDDLHMTISLFYLEQLSLKEIADIMEVPEGTVKSRLYRGREKLIKLYNPRKGGIVHEHE